jgi:autoinducer 2-degrading protein
MLRAMTHVMMPTLFIRPEHTEQCIRLIAAEVEHARRAEPGILRFDLARDQADPDAIHVYAVYRDAAAYAFHQAQPYYAQLMQAIEPWFSRPPLIRVATSLLPRPADWESVFRARQARSQAQA